MSFEIFAILVENALSRGKSFLHRTRLSVRTVEAVLLRTQFNDETALY